MNKKLLTTFFVFSLMQISFSLNAQDKTLHFISNSHLDTQWNWDVTTTIDQYILNTMTQNFPLLDKYSNFQFNFEAAIHYMWMKEYYPSEYARLKNHIKNGRWNISGGSINANDVMVPSAESIIRNFLYGQTYFKKEFGRKGGSDIMLPDCFGFPYSLPTLGKHCGITGFHTQKLSWGSAYSYNSLPPFAIWRGVDGSEIYAVLKLGPYDEHEKYNKDMSKDSDIINEINSHEQRYGFPGTFRYVGPRSDRGGGLKDNPNESGENTPYWLHTSVDSDGPINVKLSTPDEIFEHLNQYKNDKYPIWDNELPMSTHGVGCYTSQAIMKYWNRKNELLADAVEKSAVFADWLGGLNYPSEVISDAWINLIWHQFHDDLTGTSIPNAYNFSYNDEVLINLNLSKTLLNTVGAVAKNMDTQVSGLPLVVYNPLSIQRTDVVEASVVTESIPSGIRVFDGNGNEVLSQILEYDIGSKKLLFIFEATVPSLGYATYELRLNEESSLQSGLIVDDNDRMLENDAYKVFLNTRGDVASIYDKEQDIELLASPIRLAMFNDRSESFPSWEIHWNDVNSNPSAYVDENVDISIVEQGALRVSLKITRSKKGSDFVQYIRLVPARINERIDFVNEVNWQTRETMLKAVFPLRASNTKATYDLSIGAIERGINRSNLYEVAGHQWANQMHTSGNYGISILNDCKYGWDKPNSSVLRLTLIHTPAVRNNYAYQKDQDLGLNTFTYSFFRHMGAWDEKTQWEASRLNQPMLAFQAPKHEGDLGKQVDFISVNSDKVAVKALKKAEESEEIIVRVYELIGADHTDVKISFPANIVSAREVNGIEEFVGSAQYSGNQLVFDINKFQPKTFALTLFDTEIENESKHPLSVPIELRYNIDVMSSDSRKNDVTSGVEYAYPAELFSDDYITSDGIKFEIGSRRNGARNAMFCNRQDIELVGMPEAKKLYILAASKNEEGSTAEFVVDGNVYPFDVPYYSGNVGVWETEYNLGHEYRTDNVAFTATHRHDVRANRNDSYSFLYMYKYVIELEGSPKMLTLPDNPDVYIFAVTLSDNENDDISPASEIISLPEFTDIEIDANSCNKRLKPVSVRSSHQNGANEGPDKAIDQNLNTKWCVTNNKTPWLELAFDQAVEICHWMVMNAGNEGFNSITKDFRLQAFDKGQWIDIDVVKNNTINKINRSVVSFTTNRVRLQIDQGEQNGNVIRILEFAVYGENDDFSSVLIPESNKEDLWVKEHFPNPVKDRTVFKCVAPEWITTFQLEVFDLSGKKIDSVIYHSNRISSEHDLEWTCRDISNGIYIYKISAFDDKGLRYSTTNKLMVNR